MARSMAHPDYVYTPWSEERRGRVSKKMCESLGAPKGYATVRGIHVPYEHRKALHYWATWIKDNHGTAAAETFIRELKARDWTGIEELKRLWGVRIDIRQNKKLIAALQREIYRARY